MQLKWMEFMELRKQTFQSTFGQYYIFAAGKQLQTCKNTLELY